MEVKVLQQEHVQQRLFHLERLFFKKRLALTIGEILVLSIIPALIFHSYFALLIASFVLICSHSFQSVKPYFFGIGWGMVGFWIGDLFHSITGMTILSILCFMTAIGIHSIGLDEVFDLSE